MKQNKADARKHLLSHVYVDVWTAEVVNYIYRPGSGALGTMCVPRPCRPHAIFTAEQPLVFPPCTNSSAPAAPTARRITNAIVTTCSRPRKSAIARRPCSSGIGRRHVVRNRCHVAARIILTIDLRNFTRQTRHNDGSVNARFTARRNRTPLLPKSEIERNLFIFLTQPSKCQHSAAATSMRGFARERHRGTCCASRSPEDSL